MSFGGALVFCAYLVFDTWRISEQMEVDDYIEGAIQLYMDIVPWSHPPSTIDHFLGWNAWTGEGDETCEGCKTLPSKVTDVLCKEKRFFLKTSFLWNGSFFGEYILVFGCGWKTIPFLLNFSAYFQGRGVSFTEGTYLFFWEGVFWVQFGGAKVHLCFKVKIFKKKHIQPNKTPEWQVQTSCNFQVCETGINS